MSHFYGLGRRLSEPFNITTDGTTLQLSTALAAIQKKKKNNNNKRKKLGNQINQPQMFQLK